MYGNLALLAAIIFLYSITSVRFERTAVNGAVLFVICGLLLGPVGLDYLAMDVKAEELRVLAELTLALVLFTDAANANLDVLKQNIRIPRRLLLVSLPLTILLGFGAGVALFGSLTLFEVAILATMLAPTDAALGKAVVSNKNVPEKIREGLTVESGLNDGICVPILFLFLALATADSNTGESTQFLAMTLIAEELGIGIAVGLGLTIIAVKLLRKCADLGWVTETWRQLPVVVLAIACFTLAQILGGSGFIACFVGGMLFGALAKQYRPRLLLAAEGTGDTMALITWVVFGATVVGQYIQFLTWEVVLYSVLSLTLIRMVPSFLSLSGTSLRTDEKLFVGWFGPRGLASVVFAVIVINEKLPGSETIIMTVVCTIVMSIVAHGLSANPLAAKLAARVAEQKK